MSLSLSLNNALSGLNVNKQAIAVLSQNIANANTQGYTRKIINQDSVYLDGTGAGVSMADITRKVDDYLTRSIRLQSSIYEKNNTISDYSDRIQILLGKPGNQDSIDANITSFFDSLQSLAATPESSSLRVNSVSIGQNLANKISELSNGLNDLRFQADQDVQTSIHAVNADLVEIDKLNKTINIESSLGKSVVELEDKRDNLVKDLSQYLDVVTYTKPTGEINISTTSGISLLDENVYELSYQPASSADSFVNDSSLSALYVYRLDDNGNRMGQPKELVSSGISNSITSAIAYGRLAGLLSMRDNKIPDIVSQLDNLAMNLRDGMNAIHNSGSGFPGASSLTGTHSLIATDTTQWSGKIRIAALGSDGKPVAGSYGDETISRPLVIDLSSLDTGNGTGKPSVQGIIDEINRSLGIPQNKVEIGNLNNITIVSNNSSMPTSPPQFNFDFNMENISTGNAKVFITGSQVLDSNGVTLTTPTSTIPTISLAGTYTTTAGSTTVTVNTSGTNTLKNGDLIYLSSPSGAIDGIPTTDFGHYFRISNVTSSGFDIVTTTAASAGGSFSVAGQTAIPSYANVAAGDVVRGKSGGTITADLSGNPTSAYYTINVNVGVEDADGNISTSVVSYRINNNASNLLNNRYAPINATGSGKMVYPSTNQPVIKALLVDADGVELSKNNGVYVDSKKGFLRIESGSGSSYVAIDPMDSTELGKPNDNPPSAATGRSFSHYFGLNNFFVDDSEEARNIKTSGSAAALKVEKRMSDNPNLLALGSLTAIPAPSDSKIPPSYGYERNIGDNTIIQSLAKLGTQAIAFSSAGKLGATQQSFSAYSGQIIGAAATGAVDANSQKDNAKTLLDGYAQRSDSISGVNLDEELANTVIYQNAYSASARIITVVNTLFDVLLQAGGR